jgi:hypothetical protein
VTVRRGGVAEVTSLASLTRLREAARVHQLAERDRAGQVA